MPERRAAGLASPRPSGARAKTVTATAHRQTLRPHERIRRRVDFQKVYERGARQHGRYCTVFILPNTLGYGRLGIAATRKLGGAVVRNRAKRLIRDIFRRNKLAPGYDVVVVPKREAVDASQAVLEADYRHTLERRLRASRPTR